MACLTPEQIELLARGFSEGSDAADLRRHIEGCSSCRRRLEECRADDEFVAKLRRLPGLPASGQPTDSSFPGYRIVREIHHGGQGTVYEAVQLATQRTVALKVLLGGPLAGERAKWRFEREVRLAASLKHPDIVTVHDSGIIHGGYYFAMDYIRGQPLDTHVRLAKGSARQIVQLLAQICDAVAHAHQRGIIHRDLKPSNILVGENGAPHILDFGLAKITDEAHKSPGRPTVTAVGQIMGTLPYMAPEQTRGESEAIDTRTDVYALGVILYELLTGSPPYKTQGIDVIEAIENIRTADPVRPSQLRRGLNSEMDAIVHKAMEKEPNRRYGSAAELREDLQAWLEGRPVSAKSQSSLYVLRKLATRHYFQTCVVLAMAGSIAGFAGVSFHLLQEQQSQAADLRQRNKEIADQKQGLEETLQQALERQRAQDLCFFLMEWEASRLDSARDVQQKMPVESPEYRAAEFLLDDALSIEDLQARLPASAAPLALFVAGERYMKAGNAAEAKATFARYVREYRGLWHPLAEARLRQLGARPAATRPSTAATAQYRAAETRK